MISNLSALNFFPGCSLVSTAKECYEAVVRFCVGTGLELHELPDWNCCGASSVHSLEPKASVKLPGRLFSLMCQPAPLLVVCPSCHLRLQWARYSLDHSPEEREAYLRLWGQPYKGISLLPFITLVRELPWGQIKRHFQPELKGLRFVSYYGCMLASPPELRDEWPVRPYVLEEMGEWFGAKALAWGYEYQCCGTYLSAVYPEATQKLVDRIMFAAKQSGADCIVTPCAMCQLNLEMRSTVEHPLPVLHFAELLCLALGLAKTWWFRHHLIDPRPLLKTYKLLS